MVSGNGDVGGVDRDDRLSEGGGSEKQESCWSDEVHGDHLRNVVKECGIELINSRLGSCVVVFLRCDAIVLKPG